jgi:hypothetical protein
LKGLVEQAASYYVKGCVLEKTSALNARVDELKNTLLELSTVSFLNKSLVVDVIGINNIER